MTKIVRLIHVLEKINTHIYGPISYDKYECVERWKRDIESTMETVEHLVTSTDCSFVKLYHSIQVEQEFSSRKQLNNEYYKTGWFSIVDPSNFIVKKEFFIDNLNCNCPVLNFSAISSVTKEWFDNDIWNIEMGNE